MIIPFSKIDKSSRVWVYQSNRKFTDHELIEINESIIDFLNDWTAHGAHLQSAFQIKYNRFIIIALNESSVEATGCSIDKCVHFIQKLEIQYNIDLLDKMNISFKQGDNVVWKENGKDTYGVIIKIITKNNKEIAEINTADGKDITKAIDNITLAD